MLILSHLLKAKEDYIEKFKNLGNFEFITKCEEEINKIVEYKSGDKKHNY